MNPKPILRMLPPSIRERLYYRFFNHRHRSFAHLFKEAPLQMAPSFKMHDLVIGDVISGQIALNGFYEYPLSREIAAASRMGGLLVDVGANMGYFSLLWVHGNPVNRVIAVEASPRNQGMISTNFKRNGVQDRCNLLACAAGDETRMVQFDLGPAEQTGWGGINPSTSGTTSVEVQMVRLDSIINEAVSIMKIDVEGADTLVIKGCEGLLRNKKIGKIYFEQNENRMSQLGIQPREALEFLSSCGYSCQPLGGGEGAATEWVATPKA